MDPKPFYHLLASLALLLKAISLASSELTYTLLHMTYTFCSQPRGPWWAPPLYHRSPLTIGRLFLFQKLCLALDQRGQCLSSLQRDTQRLQFISRGKMLSISDASGAVTSSPVEIINFPTGPRDPPLLSWVHCSEMGPWSTVPQSLKGA